MSNLGSEMASRLMTAIAIGSFTTAAAGVGTAIVLTGSASPAAWVAAYQHAQECTGAVAAQDPNCSASAAKDWAKRQLAAELEQQTADLKSKHSPAASPSPDESAPVVDAPAPAPQAPAGTRHDDDSGEAGDD